MTKRQFQSLITQYILPNLSAYSVKGGLLWKQPIGLYLSGVSFEPSRWDKNEFRAIAFIQPLYVPRSYLVYTVGEDLGTLDGGGQKWWEYHPSTITTTMSDVLRIIHDKVDPWFTRMKTPCDFVEYVKKTPYMGINERQEIVYSYILAGDHVKVMHTFDEIERSSTQLQEPIYQWVHDRYAECREMKTLYIRDPHEAITRLYQYRKTTLEGLKLIEFAAEIDG